MGDPLIWYSVNALIDGIDPGSTNPVERMKFMVYQRRMQLEAMKTQVMLLAFLNPGKADEAAKAYFDMALPTDKMQKIILQHQNEEMMKEIEKMGPIPIKDVIIGQRQNESYIDHGSHVPVTPTYPVLRGELPK